MERQYGKKYIYMCMTPVQGDSSCYMSYKLYAITAFTLLVSDFHYCDVTSGGGEGEMKTLDLIHIHWIVKFKNTPSHKHNKTPI